MAVAHRHKLFHFSSNSIGCKSILGNTLATNHKRGIKPLARVNRMEEKQVGLLEEGILSLMV